jgi:hypothetical protein
MPSEPRWTATPALTYTYTFANCIDPQVVVFGSDQGVAYYMTTDDFTRLGRPTTIRVTVTPA